MSLYDKSIVASGHELVSQAAAEILEAGGNAFDAVVAAGFASAVVEPALTSLGGGGLLVGRLQTERRNIFYDFFVDTPGRGSKMDGASSDFFPVRVDFSGSSQDFHVGLGSVAVPGVLKGLLHTHSNLGSMPFEDVVRPAKELARTHVLNGQQAHFLTLLRPIMTLSNYSRGVYQPDGSCLVAGDEIKNLDMADFLDRLVHEGDESFYFGDVAEKIDKEMREGGGILTKEDLAAYRVIERSPLVLPYRNHLFVTAPEPSMGGTLVGLSLIFNARYGVDQTVWGSREHLFATVSAMSEVERQRGLGVTDPRSLQAFLADEKQFGDSAHRARFFSRGTTHVSVADRYGNCASMTCSNGEGSGYVAPGTGVMLNNMMGEDDLHPEGFHSSPSGKRVFSMMSPSLVIKDDKVELVIGSGGSKRIRTAISHVVSQVVDFSRPLQTAVDAPRLYLDGSCLQVEPGFSLEVVEAIEKTEVFGPEFKVNVWPQKDVYFGGVHAVIPGIEGAGDSRRGGAVRVVPSS
ncbi:gamma-glutamyltransferase family protein [Desulforhopalus sp. IMCC35007]|uniref:gamma-glutamyltransferase family protein n=1 Tax=Desulforhopalus sp. IMCC35007 TaxID=2569543 RepID=UPI00145E51DA|nr:gamma-glutamyltransferase [Desulforhopalus sp. IMCC35007]